jgi:hypothetical protein
MGIGQYKQSTHEPADRQFVHRIWHVAHCPGDDTMRKTTIYFPDEMKCEIEAVSKMEQRPEAEIIREAVNVYLEDRRSRRWPRSFGSAADGLLDPTGDAGHLAISRKPDSQETTDQAPADGHTTPAFASAAIVVFRGCVVQ